MLPYLDMTLTYRLTLCSHNVVPPSGQSSDSSSHLVHWNNWLHSGKGWGDMGQHQPAGTTKANWSVWCSLYITVIDSLIGLCNSYISDLGSLIGLCDSYISVVGKTNVTSLMGWWLYLAVESGIANLAFTGVACYLFVTRGPILTRGAAAFTDFCLAVPTSITRHAGTMVGIHQVLKKKKNYSDLP